MIKTVEVKSSWIGLMNYFGVSLVCVAATSVFIFDFSRTDIFFDACIILLVCCSTSLIFISVNVDRTVSRLHKELLKYNIFFEDSFLLALFSYVIFISGCVMGIRYFALGQWSAIYICGYILSIVLFIILSSRYSIYFKSKDFCVGMDDKIYNSENKFYLGAFSFYEITFIKCNNEIDLDLEIILKDDQFRIYSVVLTCYFEMTGKCLDGFDIRYNYANFLDLLKGRILNELVNAEVETIEEFSLHRFKIFSCPSNSSFLFKFSGGQIINIKATCDFKEKKEEELKEVVEEQQKEVPVS